MGTMPALRRQKITFGEMRSSGVRGLLINCAKMVFPDSTPRSTVIKQNQNRSVESGQIVFWARLN